jgi:hypothetical protein
MNLSHLFKTLLFKSFFPVLRVTSWSIPKQLEESVCGSVSFPPQFSFSLASCLFAMIARSEQTFRGASLSHSRFFRLFRYTYPSISHEVTLKAEKNLLKINIFNK